MQTVAFNPLKPNLLLASERFLQHFFLNIRNSQNSWTICTIRTKIIPMLPESSNSALFSDIRVNTVIPVMASQQPQEDKGLLTDETDFGFFVTLFLLCPVLFGRWHLAWVYRDSHITEKHRLAAFRNCWNFSIDSGVTVVCAHNGFNWLNKALTDLKRAKKIFPMLSQYQQPEPWWIHCFHVV